MTAPKPTKSEHKISTALGMFEAMRYQRDKAQAGLDAAQAEIRRQRDRADRAEATLSEVSEAVRSDGSATAQKVVEILAIKASA